MLLVQVSDLHLDRPDDAQDRRFQRVAAAIRALTPAPDLILATGDLVDDPAPERYRLAADRLAGLPAPVRLLPGNHDGRWEMRAAFPEHTYLGNAGPMDYALTDPEMRLICLDTLVEGAVHGQVSAEQIAWLRQRLAEDTTTPTLLALHHPPMPIGIDGLDRIRAFHERRLGAALVTQSQVARVVCGHVHMPVTADIAGRPAMTAPSVAAGFEPGWTGATARSSDAPPGFLVHQVIAGSGIASHPVWA